MQSPARPKLAGAERVVLIDNFDSFTWNVYQYLELEGATVTVLRNDEIGLEQLVAFEPTQLVISPGPGNPVDDAGISRDAIKHFSGKIPILGVCMGQQCMYSVFGGKVEVTGEILHGKTSPLQHDSKGLFAGLSQDIPVTRYHSLAGTQISLPDCLEVSAWTVSRIQGAQNVIQGIRHKTFVAEGVQFHPESILSAEGRAMLRNFLHMRGGTWAENEQFQQSQNDKPVLANVEEPLTSQNEIHAVPVRQTFGARPSILEEIFKRRKIAIANQKLLPSLTPANLQSSYDLGLAPPRIFFPDRLRQSPYRLSLMAEVKRASPSKGDIAPTICAPAQAKEYALAGASVISVLTEPEYFKGGLEDMRAVRQILNAMPNRPAVLRKEFVFDEYQILEARLAGADTVLLIVKMLEIDLLSRLYHYAQSLQMEPLVEVNTVDEMQIALRLGAKVIGVNNRNLTNFDVDLDTTSRLMANVPKDIIVCALSGITGPADVDAYRRNGVSAILVGEALMRTRDVKTFVRDLLSESGPSSTIKPNQQSAPKLIKICGTRTAAAAQVAIESGADLIGIILVNGRTRYVSDKTALEISQVVHTTSKKQAYPPSHASSPAEDFFTHSLRHLTHPSRSLLVGVFRDQPLDYILSKIQLLNLDIIQLHGSEPLEWCTLIPRPVIKRFIPSSSSSPSSSTSTSSPSPEISTPGHHAVILLDSATGGSGVPLDMESLKATLSHHTNLRVILAGGLDAGNLQTIMRDLGPLGCQVVGFDVSSGVEDENGVQSCKAIREFVEAGRLL